MQSLRAAYSEMKLRYDDSNNIAACDRVATEIIGVRVRVERLNEDKIPSTVRQQH